MSIITIRGGGEDFLFSLGSMAYLTGVLEVSVG